MNLQSHTEKVLKIERDIEYVVSNPDMYDVPIQVRRIISEALSSRDEEWRKRIEDERKMWREANIETFSGQNEMHDYVEDVFTDLLAVEEEASNK